MALLDSNKLIDLFKATLDSAQRESAEGQLTMIHKMNGFNPALLQLVMRTDVDMPVRQAASIYLKHSILSYWGDKKAPPKEGDYIIPDNDREFIVNAIIDAIVLADDLISKHLAVCINHLIKLDGPGIVKKLPIYLQAQESKYWMGSFLALYQLVKVYEFKNFEERAPLDEAMRVFLPLSYSRCLQLLPDNSLHSVLIQKQILKIFRAFVQNSLPLKLLDHQTFTDWIHIFLAILERPIVDATSQVPLDEREEIARWKCKKWVLHNLSRIFERYGSPENVESQYKEFAKFYIKAFSSAVIGHLLKILEQQGNKQHVDSRVLQTTLNYLCTAVDHSFTWKLIKPHMLPIIQNILFPLMCHTEQDEEMWNNDPQEYIKFKFDIFGDFVSPVTIAQKLLHTCSSRRKGMLQKILAFIVQVLNDNTAEPQMKDGALHMIGTIADILLRKKPYRDQIEDLLVTYAFPYFQSPHGYLRAKACWMLNYFAQSRFQHDSNLITAFQSVEQCLLREKELPVKVQAALCLQGLATSQEKAHKFIENNLTNIVFAMLNIIRETKSEDLTSPMQKFVCYFREHLTPIAIEMTQHLAQTFYQILDGTDAENDDKTMTIMGVLNTIDSILTVMEDEKKIKAQLEPIVVQLVFKIFHEELLDLYEEALTLVCTMSTYNISPDLWKIYELMYQVFKNDGFDYFDDMMPALHNFITVDPHNFVANRNNILAMYDMCKTVMNKADDEDIESYAAKLLECMILQFKGQIDDCIRPFVELVMTRLTRGVQVTSLRKICLQVIIAAFYYNPILLQEILAEMPFVSDMPLFAHFVHQWINYSCSFHGLHDRKMCVLGLITLMSLPAKQRPQVVNDIAQIIVPTILKVFKDLKQAYKNKANAENESSDIESDSDDEDQEIEELDDEEDHVPIQYDDDDRDLDDDGDSYTDDEDDEFNQTPLESFSTILDNDDIEVDEYVAFKETLESIQSKDPNWYMLLMNMVDPSLQKSLQEVFVFANQRKAAAESRQIEKHGGYKFSTQTVPPSFNFGAKPN